MAAQFKLLTVFAALVALAACSLPRGAALQSEVLHAKNAENPTFEVVAVTRENIPGILAWSAHSGYGSYHWPNTSEGANSSTIRTGDLLDVTIWDSQDNSLLTNPGERYTKIQNLEVDGNGSIYLPYVNKVGVRGLTTSGARAKIQSRLEPIVPSAQVQLSLRQGRDHSVDVVGGVTKPGAYPMPSRNYKILNVISDAGGIPSGMRNPQVRLIRGTSTYEISANKLFEDGSKNALLQPRDTVYVEPDERSFTSLGASGQESLIYFPKDEVTALEAMSLMGGLADFRADPKGVLVLREYKPEHLAHSGPGPTMQQVVFTFDLTSADGLFAAKKFPIHPDDTVLATESPVNSIQTVFALVGSAFGLTARAVALSN
ncbi:polysaccharide biosynthesis/export family protein [Tropicibacter sp. S64]|uniref:polysaccharide biosynthesis/export family protein n=1 Tax=Tropicibacter sp. S64 TaxID=3415122 RepID=UPI003C7A61E4